MSPVGAPLLAMVLRGLGRTWHAETSGAEHLDRLLGRPFLFALWHRTLVPLLWWHRGLPIALLVSTHRDGEIVARAASRLGYDLVRGSSTRGGATGLRGVLRALARGIPVAVTPDGPAGPPRTVKPGVIRAARRAAVPILPLAAVADRHWEARSWDGLVVPRPGARITIRYGEPLQVDGLDDAAAGAALSGRLDALVGIRTAA